MGNVSKIDNQAYISTDTPEITDNNNNTLYRMNLSNADLVITKKSDKTAVHL